MTTHETSEEVSDEQASGQTLMSTGNEEPIRKCPYCGEEKKSRGLFAHVMNTKGGGHGPYREVPDDFSVDDTEIVGFKNIDARKPISESDSGNELILCKLCGNTSKGMHGYHIHIRKMAGKNGHPENPENIQEHQIRAIPADEYWRPVGSSADRELDEEYKEMIDWEQGNTEGESENTQPGMFVPVKDMKQLRDLLLSSPEKQPVIDEMERIMQRYS